MKFYFSLVSVLLFAALSSNAAQIKTVDDSFKKSVVYQILLTSFTQEGTLKKAEQMLPYVKSLGVDIVYLCPLSEHDSDMDKTFWSDRQRGSRTGNPKNPYRIKDYFKIDPQYGSSDDVKSFVDKAHSLGLKVLFDVVYYHCGPKANLITQHPDFVLRDPDGKVSIGEWRFPRLDFKNPKLRDYLAENMEFFVKTYNIDGFRTDVGAMVPSDFWDMAYDRISKIKPNLIMIEESERPSALNKVYDATYEVGWQRKIIEVFHEKKSASILRNRWNLTNKLYPKGGRVLRAMENHDFANGPFRKRCEIRFGYRGMDAVQVLNFTLDGIPFLYSGNEFADDAPMTIFSNNKYGRYFTEWANMFTEQGQRRLALVKKLIQLRHSNPVFYDGSTNWFDTSNPDSILAFSRSTPNAHAIVLINTSDSPQSLSFPSDISSPSVILNYGSSFKISNGSFSASMAPKGYLVISY